MIFKKSSLSIKDCDYHSTGPVTAQSTSSPELSYLPASYTACPGPKWRPWRSISGSPLRLAKLFVAKKDDILIFTKSFQEHRIHVCSVLQRIVENRLYKTDKCEFYYFNFMSAVTLFSHTFFLFFFGGGGAGSCNVKPNVLSHEFTTISLRSQPYSLPSIRSTTFPGTWRKSSVGLFWMSPFPALVLPTKRGHSFASSLHATLDLMKLKQSVAPLLSNCSFPHPCPYTLCSMCHSSNRCIPASD